MPQKEYIELCAIPRPGSLFFYYCEDGQVRAYKTFEEYQKDKHPVTFDILDTEE